MRGKEYLCRDSEYLHRDSECLHERLGVSVWRCRVFA